MSNFAAARAASKRRKLAHPVTAVPAPTAVIPVKSKSFPTKSVKLGNLTWKNVELPSEFGFNEDGGLLGLEEIEGVEVFYGDGSGLASFRVRLSSPSRSIVRPG